MNIRDLLHETSTSLHSNKVRSGLTILGIVIGISSVIAMVSIGAGASSTISSSIQSLGSNLIQVTPGFQQGPGFGASAGRGASRTLTLGDADAIAREVSGVQLVASTVSGRYQIVAKGTNTNTTVNGVDPAYALIRNVSVDEGSFITASHNVSGARVAVLGPTTRDDLFGEGVDAIDGQIRINGIQFKVIGITAAKGGTGFQNQDDVVYIPLRAAQRYLSGDQYLSSINIQAEDAESMALVQEDVVTLLTARHRIKEGSNPDFTVLNQSEILSAASTITATLTYLLAAIGGISLLVGGIGIMNMMLTNVTERTKEIGLRKAIGAKPKDIAQQFLAEAIALTLIGGVIGILLGWGISYAVNLTGVITTTVTLSSVVLAFGVSAMTGIVFGYYPAKRASKLNPIDALRYE